MTGAELKAARQRLNLSANAFARLMGVTPRVVFRWQADEWPVPRSIEYAIAYFRLLTPDYRARLIAERLAE